MRKKTRQGKQGAPAFYKVSSTESEPPPEEPEERRSEGESPAQQFQVRPHVCCFDVLFWQNKKERETYTSVTQLHLA